jgi:uridine phosphorylase
MLDSTIIPSDPFKSSELILRENGSVYHLGVRGENLADTIIVVGDPDRVEIISAYFDSVNFRISGREFTIHTGVLNGHQLSVVSTGIGVDNIDIVMNELDAAVNIDPETRMVRSGKLRKLRVLRLGTSGSLHDSAGIGSYVGSEYALGMEGLPFHYKTKFESDELELAKLFTNFSSWPHELARPYAVKSGADLKSHFGNDVISGITLTANGFYGPQGRALRLPPASDDYHDRIRDFSFRDIPLTNFEMECAGLYALGAMLGHDVYTICVILADRNGKKFHPSPSSAIIGLVEMVLHRLTS